MRPENKRIKSAVSKAVAVIHSAMILSALCAAHSGAAVYESNGSAVNVQRLHNSAQNGDTITLPAGNFNWERQISITKAITLQGAGAGVTNITSTCKAGQAVGIRCVPGRTTVIRDFSVGSFAATNCFFLVTGSGVRQFRFTGLSFYSAPGRYTIWISYPGDTNKGEGPYGLIHNCTWSEGASGVFIRDNPKATPNSWNRPMTLGTEQATYVEDCTFSAVSRFPNANVAMDGDNGCRVVFRHNRLQDYCFGTHGADSSGLTNSALQHEVMHNTFTVTDQVGQDFAIQLRGGTAVVFDNTLNRQGNGEYNALLKLSYFRASAGGGGVCKQDRYYPQDYVGTMQPGSGYRVPGQDPNFPNEPWGSVPVYVWNNHLNAPVRFGQVATGLDANAASFMKEGRDYFVGTGKPGYSEFAYPHTLQTGSPSSAVSGTPNSQERHQKRKKKWGKAKVNFSDNAAEPRDDSGDFH
jgi:hypothetical protein